MAWESLDIAPTSDPSRRGSPRATMSVRRVSGNAKTLPAVNLNALLAAALGWKKASQIQAQIDRAAGLLRLTVGSPGRALNGKDGGGVRVALPLPWVPAEARPAEVVAHTVEGAALILRLPEWARPPLASATPPSEPKPAAPPRATADRREPTPAEEDQREAEAMVVAGQGARAIAEYFGWPLADAQAFVARVRERIAELRA